MTIAFALSPMAKIIGLMYGIGKDISSGIDKLIDDMKISQNSTISRTGRMLEGAKFGFGIGYIAPVVVVAVGQMLLGHPLLAIKAVALALPNPISMTCAAVGAIIYGWNALSQQEREETLEKLSKGLEIGIELIKAIIRFVIEKSKELFSSENIEEIKQFIGSTAAVFGKTISDVTHKFTDIVGDGYDAIKKKTGVAVDKTVDFASDTYRASSEAAEKAAGNIWETAGKVSDGIRGKLGRVDAKDTTKPDSQ